MTVPPMKHKKSILIGRSAQGAVGFQERFASRVRTGAMRVSVDGIEQSDKTIPLADDHEEHSVSDGRMNDRGYFWKWFKAGEYSGCGTLVFTIGAFFWRL